VQSAAGGHYRLSRQDGEVLLDELARTAPTEDAWLLVGDTWFDVGYREERRSVLVDRDAAAAAVRTGIRGAPTSLIGFYHIHPSSGEPAFIDPPSLQDIQALASLKDECRALTAAEVIGVLFDGRGRWTFDVTWDLERRILRGYGQPTDYATSHGWGPARDSAAVFDLEYPLIAWSLQTERLLSRDERIGAYVEGARRMGVLVHYDPVIRAPPGDEPAARHARLTGT
jgi:hypothetical protein